MKRMSCHTRGGTESKREMEGNMPVTNSRVSLRSTKRSRLAEPSSKHERSFESVAKANLSEEAGVRPLSPEKKSKYAFHLRESHGHGESTPEVFRSEIDLSGVYYPRMESFPESFFVYNSKREYQVQQNDSFNRLPDEMILRVLHWVPRNSLGIVAKVNRRLNRLARDETLWKRVDIHARTLADNHFNMIMSRKPVYARFAYSAMTRLHPEFNQTCNQLTHLDLSMAQINPNILAQLFQNAPNISHLSLEHIAMDDDSVTAMATFAPTIQVLNLAMTYNIPALTLRKFLTEASKLEQLNLSNIKQEWSSEDFSQVMHNLPSSLEQLNISGFRHELKDSHVKELTRKCSRLIHLDVSDCQDLTNKSVEYIVFGLHDLEHLALSRCYNIEPPCYQHLKSAKKLRFLQLYTLFKDSSLKTLNASFPGIQINGCLYSTVARPTTGLKRSSIWGVRVRD